MSADLMDQMSGATKPTARTLDRIELLTSPPEGDDLLAEEVIFRSKGANFKAIRIGQRRWKEDGETQVSGRVAYEFGPNGEFRTRDARAVTYLEKLDSFNLEFWRVGSEPGAPPSSDQIIERIMELALEFDDAGLEEIETAEQSTHQRGDVLKTVAAARRKVQGVAESTG